jgi:hypothetical protein
MIYAAVTKKPASSGLFCIAEHPAQRESVTPDRAQTPPMHMYLITTYSSMP